MDWSYLISNQITPLILRECSIYLHLVIVLADLNNLEIQRKSSQSFMNRAREHLGLTDYLKHVSQHLKVNFLRKLQAINRLT